MRSVLFITLVLLFPFTLAAQSDEVPGLSDYAWGFPIEVSESASFYSVELPLEVNQSVTDPELGDAGVYNSDGNPLPRMFEQAGDERELVVRSNPLPTLPLYETVDRRNDQNELLLEREGDSTQCNKQHNACLFADTSAGRNPLPVPTRTFARRHWYALVGACGGRTLWPAARI